MAAAINPVMAIGVDNATVRADFFNMSASAVLGMYNSLYLSVSMTGSPSSSWAVFLLRRAFF